MEIVLGFNQKAHRYCLQGGNILLNVGPTSEGVLPEASIKRWKGNWCMRRGNSLLGYRLKDY